MLYSKKIKLASIMLFLTACSPAFTIIPYEMQNRLVGLSIGEVEKRIGAPSNITIRTSGKKYSWVRRDTIQKNTSPALRVAGTRMINGHNVSSIVNMAPIQTVQTTTCSLDIATDRLDLITGISLTGGGDCSQLLARLKSQDSLDSTK